MQPPMNNLNVTTAREWINATWSAHTLSDASTELSLNYHWQRTWNHYHLHLHNRFIKGYAAEGVLNIFHFAMFGFMDGLPRKCLVMSKGFPWMTSLCMNNTQYSFIIRLLRLTAKACCCNRNQPHGIDVTRCITGNIHLPSDVIM